MTLRFPTVFFLDGLDTYTRRWLKARQDFLQTAAAPLVPLGAQQELDQAILDVAEALVLGDGVAIFVPSLRRSTR